MQLKIDLHVHTNHSACALLRPEQIEGIALKRGLGAVAITDHNTIRGAREVQAAAASIRIIIGEEIRTSRGEITGLFLQEEISPFQSPAETVSAIRRQGGLVAIPHPFDRLRTSRIEKTALEEIIDEVDMIEVFNSRDILTRKDPELIRKALKSGAAAIVSSDAHLAVEVGRSTITLPDFRTPAEFLQSLQSARLSPRKSPFWVHLVTKVLKARKKKKAGA